ncbi:MAG: hypothetical protein GEU75_09800 [Dehalococcoidia bacterium]|nr:hypothetical protein [Dehalococcoidia bacterium]
MILSRVCHQRRYFRLACGLALGLALLSACSSDADNDPLGGGPRFLVAGANVITERTATEQRILLGYDDGSFLFDAGIGPEGQRIAFIRQLPATTDAGGEVDFGSDVYLADSDGSRPRNVLAHSQAGEFMRNPTWLNNNELLVNVRGRDRNGQPDLRIEVLDLGTGARKRLIDNAVEIALSPDRKRIVYVLIDPETRIERLTVSDLDGANSIPLTPETSPLVFISSLAWSPDGTTIGFTSADPSTGAVAPEPGSGGALAHPTLQDVWLVRPDGSNLHRLAELAESQPSIAWSSDSKSLYAVGLAGFWRIDPATGAMEVIAPGIPFAQIRLLSD